MINIKEFDHKLTMPKTGKLLGLSDYQEEIIDHLMFDNQTIYYKARMGNSTAVIYYLFLNLLMRKDFHIVYIAANEESLAKIKKDFELYLSYNLRYIEDRNYSEDGNLISIETTGSSVLFIDSKRIEKYLEFNMPIKEFPKHCDKVMCENYVFPSWAEKELEKSSNCIVQYLLEN